MTTRETSVEPEEERLLLRRRLRLEEPVEERPPGPLVHRDVAGELRHARGLRLAGEARHPVAVPPRAGREGEQGENGDEAEDETCSCHRHEMGGDALGAWECATGVDEFSGVGGLLSWSSSAQPQFCTLISSPPAPPFRCKWQSLWPVKWHTGKSLMMNCWQS